MCLLRNGVAQLVSLRAASVLQGVWCRVGRAQSEQFRGQEEMEIAAVSVQHQEEHTWLARLQPKDIPHFHVLGINHISLSFAALVR